MTANAIQWAQTRRQPASKQRDPIQGEFFNTDSITTLAKQVTREGIGQNPLDAGVTEPVRVRVHVSGDSGALTPATAASYFQGLRDHIHACDPAAARVFDDPCRYLVIEDFNTTGLRGDPSAVDAVEGAEEVNDFFYFFRAEGKSGKSGADRGRWGVGKYVFPMASHINSFFALTVRSNGAPGGAGPLLMGQAVLKNHRHNDQGYEPDGWWSRIVDEVPVPITNAETINEFRATWNVTRDGDPGLSVVLPYVRPDLGAEDVARAVLLDYYLAVLRSKFEVVITSPELDDEIVITADGLDGVLDRLPDPEEREELRKQISIALWHLTLPDTDFVQVKQISGETPRWGPDLIDEADRARLRDALDAGNPIAIRVPVQVDRKDIETASTWSYFDVVMSPDPSHSGKPEFVREGLIVPEVSSQRLSTLRCLVTIDDAELARMVGDAEGPAHTNWSARTQKFSGKYRHGQQWLTMIKRAPAEILRIIRAEDEEADRRVMARFFPAAPDAPTPPVAGGEEQDPEPDPGPGPDPDPNPPEPGRRRIRVSRISGGFSIHLTGHGDPVRRVRISVAYDRRRGNPFKNWQLGDFDLAKLPLEFTGGLVTRRTGNELLIEVDDPENFSLQVRGFDENRDLRIDARAEGAE